MNLAKMTGSMVVLAALAGNMSAQVVTIPGSVVNSTIVDSLQPSFGQLTVSGWTAPATDISAYLKVSDAGGIVNGDYYAYLTHGVGAAERTAVLLNRVGRTYATSPVAEYGYTQGGGFNVVFRNGAPNIHTYQDVTGGPATPLTGIWSPDGRTGGSAGPGVGGQGLTEVVDAIPKDFSVFNGQDLNGLWTLGITDMSSGGQGTLVGWGMTMTAVPEPQEYAIIFGLGLAAFAIYRRRTQAA